MKLCVKLAAIAVIVASLSRSQPVTLSIPALDQAGNPIPIGKFYATWQPFTSNSGVTVPGGAISSNITDGVINTTLTASDSAGYVYDILIMNGATPNTFQWKVPAGGATTMAELNKPSVSESAGASGPAGGDLSGSYPNPTLATGKPTLNNIGDPTTSKTFSMGSNSLNLAFGSATSGSNMLTATDSTSNTGTGYVATIGTAGGSSANPFQVVCKSAGCLTVTANGSIGLSNTNPSAILEIGSPAFASRDGLYIHSVSGFYPLKVYNGAINEFQVDNAGNVTAEGVFDTFSGIRVSAFGAYMGILSGNRFVFNNGNVGIYSSSDTLLGTFGDSALQWGSANQFSVSNAGTTKTAGLQTAIRSVTAALDTSTRDDYTLLCNAVSSSSTEKLPTSPITGEERVYKKTDSSGNTCTLDGNGKNIDGGTTIALSAQYKYTKVQYDGTQWWIVGGN